MTAPAGTAGVSAVAHGVPGPAHLHMSMLAQAGGQAGSDSTSKPKSCMCWGLQNYSVYRQLGRLGDWQLMQAPRRSSCSTDLRLQGAPPQHAHFFKQRNPVASTGSHLCCNCLPAKGRGMSWTAHLDVLGDVTILGIRGGGQAPGLHACTPSSRLGLLQVAIWPFCASPGMLLQTLQDMASQHVWSLSNLTALCTTLTCIVAGQEGHCSGASIWHIAPVAGPKHLLRLRGKLDFGDGSCNCQGSSSCAADGGALTTAVVLPYRVSTPPSCTCFQQAIALGSQAPSPDKASASA